MTLTPRMQKSQQFHRVCNEQSAEVKCLTCGAIHKTGRDEDGGGAIDQEPCHSDTCEAMLCLLCDKGQCESCGLTHCSNCLKNEGLGLMCDVCRESAEEPDAA